MRTERPGRKLLVAAVGVATVSYLDACERELPHVNVVAPPSEAGPVASAPLPEAAAPTPSVVWINGNLPSTPPTRSIGGVSGPPSDAGRGSERPR